MDHKPSFVSRFAGRLLSSSALAALLALASTTAGAASLQVAPVQLEFPPGQQALALFLINTGNETVQTQVRVQRWSQPGGVDRLDATDEIVASPAMVSIGPGERQLVRLVRSQPAAPASEQSFRVLVDEMPGEDRDPRSGVRLLLRYSLPLFVAAAGQASPYDENGRPIPVDLSKLSASLGQNSDGGTELRLRNDGGHYVRIGSLGLAPAGAGGAPDGAAAPDGGLLGYVLPGQQVAFEVDVPYPLPANQVLKARFNDDRDARPVPLDRAGP